MVNLKDNMSIWYISSLNKLNPSFFRENKVFKCLLIQASVCAASFLCICTCPSVCFHVHLSMYMCGCKYVCLKLYLNKDIFFHHQVMIQSKNLSNKIQNEKNRSLLALPVWLARRERKDSADWFIHGNDRDRCQAISEVSKLQHLLKPRTCLMMKNVLITQPTYYCPWIRPISHVWRGRRD